MDVNAIQLYVFNFENTFFESLFNNHIRQTFSKRIM